MYDPFEDAPTSDQLDRVVMLDRRRKVVISIKLIRPDGAEIDLKELIGKLSQFVRDELDSGDENNTKGKVLPLMGQSMIPGLSDAIGYDYASFLVSHDVIRHSIVHLMTVGFYLLKWIQSKEVKIVTSEEAVSEEELARIERLCKASNAAVIAGGLGYNPKEVVEEMVKRGTIRKEDLRDLMGNRSTDLPDGDDDLN